MKLFTFILSFWMLYLACMPCGDRSDCSMKGKATVSSSTNHQQHKNDAEHCTPFCICSCCSTSLSTNTVTLYTFSNQVFEKKTYGDYNNPICSDLSLAIWQPPRLS